MRVGLRTIVTLGLCCAVLIWSTAPNATITAPIPAPAMTATPSVDKAQLLAEKVSALKEDIQHAARQLEAAGAATAAAASTIQSLAVRSPPVDPAPSLSAISVAAGPAGSPAQSLAVPSVAQVSAAPSGLEQAAAPAAAAASPPAAVAQPKACPAGCEKWGVCNSDLGRCDCQPFMGGDDCSKPLIGACAR